jgi:hypothetical protein
MNILEGNSLALLLNELCPQSDESLGFHSEKPSCKTPTARQLMDVLSRLKLLNTLMALAVFHVRSFTAKGICLHEPIQGLNLNCQSISGLEPEMLVTLGFTVHCDCHENNPNVK